MAVIYLIYLKIPWKDVVQNYLYRQTESNRKNLKNITITPTHLLELQSPLISPK